MIQFDRVASLFVGTETTGLLIEDLRIKFSVKKNSSSKSNNTSKITVYNLSETTRNTITETGKLATLSAGYRESGTTDIFVGDISNSNIERNEADILTVLDCSDGSKALSETNEQLSFAEGTKNTTILDALIKKFPLAVKYLDIPTDAQGKESLNGFSMADMAGSMFDSICDKMGVEWSIQDNQLQILAPDATNGDTIENITVASGLIGNPKRIKAKPDARDGFSGWRIETLLKADATIGGKVLVTSREIGNNKPFKIVALNHNGDTHGNDWKTTLDLKEVE